jgi:hypothetical protein
MKRRDFLSAVGATSIFGLSSSKVWGSITTPVEQKSWQPYPDGTVVDYLDDLGEIGIVFDLHKFDESRCQIGDLIVPTYPIRQSCDYIKSYEVKKRTDIINRAKEVCKSSIQQSLLRDGRDILLSVGKDNEMLYSSKRTGLTGLIRAMSESMSPYLLTDVLLDLEEFEEKFGNVKSPKRLSNINIHAFDFERTAKYEDDDIVVGLDLTKDAFKITMPVKHSIKTVYNPNGYFKDYSGKERAEFVMEGKIGMTCLDSKCVVLGVF